MKNIITISILIFAISSMSLPIFGQSLIRFSISHVEEVGTDSLKVYFERDIVGDCDIPITYSWNNELYTAISDTTLTIAKTLGKHNFAATIDDDSYCYLIDIARINILNNEIIINRGKCSYYSRLEPIATSLGSPIDGPYLPSEEVSFTYWHGFTPVETACQWMQGVIPNFNVGWDLNSVRLDSVDPGGNWQVYQDSMVKHNEPSYFLATYIDSFGIYRLCDISSPNYNTGTHVGYNIPLPYGWFYYSPGGNPCENTGHPNTGWGYPQSCTEEVMFSFNFTIKVNDTLDIFDCQQEHFRDLDMRMFAFADGETGCWGDEKCGGSTPFHLDCELEGPVMPKLQKSYSFFEGETITYDVEDPDYKIESWSFEVDTITVFSSTSINKRSGNEYFDLVSETDRSITLIAKNPLSNEELQLLFHFNVVKIDNPAYVFTSDVSVSVCERYISELPDVTVCGEIEFYSFDISEYLLKEDLIVTYTVNGVTTTGNIITLSDVQESTLINYEIIDLTGCRNLGSYTIKVVNSPQININYNPFICNEEYSNLEIVDTMSSFTYQLQNCEGDTIGTGLNYQLSGGCYKLLYSDSLCTYERSIDITQEIYPEVYPKTYFKCKGKIFSISKEDLSSDYIKFNEELSGIEVTEDNIFVIDEGSYDFKFSMHPSFDCFGTSILVVIDYEEIKTITTIKATTPDGNTGAIELLSISGGTPPYSFLWDDGVITKDRSNLTEGEYVVEIKDINGCIKEIKFQVYSNISAVDNKKLVWPNIWPNPVVDRINIDQLDQFVGDIMEIYDMSGNRVYQEIIQNSNQIIELSKYSKGLYLIKISNQFNDWVSKFVIQ